MNEMNGDGDPINGISVLQNRSLSAIHFFPRQHVLILFSHELLPVFYPKTTLQTSSFLCPYQREDSEHLLSGLSDKI